MARTRLLKPSFFTNDALAECDPLTRILFAGLWCLADREGKLLDRPKRIKAELLPYDDGDANVMLQSLSDKGFITRYEVSGENIISINNFYKHQHPHKTESESTLPNNGETTVRQPLSNGGSRALTLNPSIDTLTLLPSAGLKENVLERKNIKLKTSTLERAKDMMPRADIYALESEWLGKEAEVPDNPDGAFIGFCKGFAKNHPELCRS